MADRRLLTDKEQQALLGIPLDGDGMARCFTLSRADQERVAGRRRDANRIGFAVQLALLRYPGMALVQLEQPVEPLVQWLAKQLELGNPNPMPATPAMAAAAQQARSHQAAARWADVLAVVRELLAEGANSLRAIAAGLHARGVQAPAGGERWSAAQVRRLLARLEITS